MARLETSHVLILGGTTLARQLIDELSDYSQFKTTVCLTRKTTGYDRADQKIIGLIPGVDSLCEMIQTENVNYLVDATHPFAIDISKTAFSASSNASIPLFTLQNPAWNKQIGDNWIDVDNHESAIQNISKLPANSHVFLSVGGRAISRYAILKKIKFTARCIRTDLGSEVKNVSIIKEKGPFDLDSELILFKANKFDYMVTKNAGGDATYAKIIAARQRGVPVVIINRPVQCAKYCTGELFESVSLFVDYLINTNEK